jgi:cell division protein FtsI (penicillin-binding protein 3)
LPDRVETSLDRHLQYRLEQALARAMTTHHAKAASAVALDPRNGEILAIASVPSFNPNEPGDAHERGARLRPVTDPFEPGSTMKTFTIAGALEAGLTRPDEPFFCENGSYKIGPAIIHDAERIGDTTLTGVLAESSNICTAKIAARQGKERMREMMLRFGFGRPTGVDLPGERAGQIRAIAKMGPVETATTSFGQGMTATPLQLASAYATIASGGVYHKPHLLRRVFDAEGRALSTTEVESHRVVTPELADTLRQLLHAVTQKGGTAEKILVPGYRFGGKTGTAQKVDPATRHYSTDKWASSFVGFAPLDDPRLVLYVLIDEPVGTHYGSQVAGPVFAETMTDAMRWLGVRPTEPITKPPAPEQRKRPPAAAPVVAELPATPAPVDEVDRTSLPDLRGLGVAEVLERAARVGARVQILGSGLAVEQTPPAGAAVPELVRVTFRPPG